jgi:nitrogen fixation NifU-like protein
MLKWAKSSQWREECTDDHTVCGVAHNRVCGDKLKIQIVFDGGKISKARHTGESCALTLAAASAVCELSEGKTREELKLIIDELRSIVLDGAIIEGSQLAEFSSIHKISARHRCVTLVTEAYEDLLNENR